MTDTTACPVWCTEGDQHTDQGYHWGVVGEMTVGSTLKDQTRTYTVSLGSPHGGPVNILASTNAWDGFEGDAKVIGDLGELLVEAADLAADTRTQAEAAAQDAAYAVPERPAHCAELAEGQDVASEIADQLAELLGHPVEICADADDDDDVAVLLYPSDVRKLLAAATWDDSVRHLAAAR